MSRRRKLILSLCLLAVATLSALDHAGVFGYASFGRDRYDGANVRIAHVVDGDTLDVKPASGNGSTTRVRLRGIDCPEIAHAAGEADAFFGPEAVAFVRKWAAGRGVRLVFDPNRDRFDKYGRLLAYIYDAESGEMLNQMLIERGFAYADRRFAHMFRMGFEQCEKRAARERIGLWAEITPQQMPLWRQRYADED